MLEAAVFGIVTSLALVIGAVLGVWLRLPQRLIAVVLAFAAGSLITALAFELFLDAYEAGGAWLAGGGLAVGAILYVLVSGWLDRRVSHPADVAGSPKLDTAAASQERDFSPSQAGVSAGLALLVAAIFDGVPENLALGIALGGEEGGGVVLLVAIAVANLPEGLVGAASMQEQGWTTKRILLTWTTAAAVLALAVVAGRALLAEASPGTVSLPLAFAGGAVVAALADTFMPEAYEKGGSAAALATAAGFLLSYLLSTL
jgi:zinc transporter, ZIP family